jgi:hypothetical protein
MKTLAAMLSAVALLSAHSALACGRGYSATHTYEKIRLPSAQSKRDAQSRVTAPRNPVTSGPAEIQSQSATALEPAL